MAFRTKKISQMDPKGSNLASTDLLEISELVSGSYVTKSITGAEIVAGVGSGFVPTSRTLTINGTTQDLSANRTFTVSTGITIGTTAITSGTVGRVLFEGTGNVVQESANLFWDNTNLRFQVGTSSTTPFGSPLIFMGKDQNGETNFQISNSTNGTGATVGFRVFGANNRSTFLGEFSQGHTGVTEFATNYVIEPNAPNIKHGLIISLPETTTGSDFMIYTGGRNAGNRKLTLFGSTGNVAINTTTDAGFKLDVNGTARVSGNTTISLNQNGVTLINASNTTSGTASTAELRATTGGGFIGLGKYSASTNSYKFIASSDSYLYSATIGDIAIINDFASGRIKFGAGASSTAQATLFSTGNFAINTTTDAGFKLDVNGTARVQDNLTISKNQNLSTRITLSNTTSGNLSQSIYEATSSNGTAQFGKTSASFSTFKILTANDAYFYNGTSGDISLLNDFATGQIKFAAGGSSTAHMTIKSNGRINMSALPTSSAGLSAGDIWNDAGTLKIV